MLSETDVDFIKKLARQIAEKHGERGGLTVVAQRDLADTIARAIVACVEVKVG